MVKSGYKQTEIGAIPEDWDIKHIGEFTDVTAGGTPSTSHSEYWNGNILWMSSGELNKRRIYDVVGRITQIGYDNSSTHFIPENCVLIGLAGQGKTRGTVAINYVKLCTNQSIAAIFPSEYHNSEYLYQNLLNRYEELRDLSSGDGGRGGLNLKIIKSLPCAFPPLPEQEHIAEALSDADSMISSLEKLIAKKKAVKQGAMQELLTGKKRLPGFIEPWRKEAKIFTFAKGVQIDGSVLRNDLPYPVFNGGTSASGYTNDYNCENTVIISEGGNSCGHVNYIRRRFWAGGHCYYITGSKVTIDFLYQLLKFHEKDIMALRVGSGLPNIQKDSLDKMVFSYPKDEKEQETILEILMNMDSEIKTLEQKLTKTRQIKQGMMQQLLTGKIRLVTEEKATTAISASEQMDLPHSRSGHNQQFDDAVMIAAIVNAFYSDKYPLGRKKVQKLLYLLRRKQEKDISAFKKKAAGPYADEVRYKGGEPIAKRQGYISTTTTQKGTAFSKGQAIDVALGYVDKWQMQADIDWLVSTFKYTKTNDLELYATIDMAICDLQHEGIAVSVDSVKDLIRSNKEWKEKLTKTYFSDEDIARAIAMCKTLYS